MLPTPLRSVRSVPAWVASAAAFLSFLSGCCGMFKDDSASTNAATATNPAADPSAAVPLTECKAVTTNIGPWAPSVAVLGRVARAIGHDTCISPNQIAATLASCASQANSATVEASVTAPSPTFSACMHTSRAMTWNGRHWVGIFVFIGEGADFHGQTYIYEIENDQPVAAYEGFAQTSELCTGEVPDPSNKTSAKLKADWPGMPANIRAFFCE